MSMRHSKFTNLQGHRTEFSRDLLVPYEMYVPREAKSQKVQQQGIHRNGTNKGRKLPLNRKLT